MLFRQTLRDMKVICLSIAAFLIHSVNSQYLKGPHDPSGSWGFWDTCSEGSFASSFQVKVVRPLLFDNEGLGAISFECSDSSKSSGSRMRLWSYEGHHGEWKRNHSCNESDFIVAYRMRYQPPQGAFADDSATSNVEVQCGSGRQMMGEGTVAGNWTSWYRCDQGKAICGLQTKVHTRLSMDQVGLVTFNTKCCELPMDKAQSNFLVDEPHLRPPTTASPNEVQVFQASSNVGYYLLGVLLILVLIGFISCVVGNFSLLKQPKRAIEEPPSYPMVLIATLGTTLRQGGKIPSLSFLNKKKTETYDV